MRNFKQESPETTWQKLIAAGALSLALALPAVSMDKPRSDVPVAAAVSTEETVGYKTLIQSNPRFHQISPSEVAPRGIVEALIGSEVIDTTGGAVGEVEAIIIDRATGRVGLVLAAARDGDATHLLAPVAEIAMLGSYLVWHRPDLVRVGDIQV